MGNSRVDPHQTVVDITRRSAEGAPGSAPVRTPAGRHTVTCFRPRAGQDADGALPDELGKLDPDRFEKRALVGKGGMGSVHLAFDAVMLRAVALKTLALDGGDASVGRQPFLEEAQITGQLDHPNIVPVYDLGHDVEGTPCFTMKYVDGQTFAAAVDRLHAQPSDALLHDLLRVFVKVCEATAFAHERGVVHCDLKPDNIMVGSHGQVYVMDWGVALLREGTRPSDDGEGEVMLADARRRRGSLGGTVGYMAPEQIDNQSDRISAKTDVYGLGGILYFLLTGKAPRHEYLMGEASAGWDIDTKGIEKHRAMPEVPPELCRIAERALRSNPDERFASVDELREEVERFLSGGGWFGTRHHKAGETIIREGEVDSEAFIITRGVCEVFKATPRGDELIRSMGPGDAFGELSVLTNLPRSATVVAKTDVDLRVVTPQTLKRELTRNPVLAAFMSAVAKRFMDLEARLESSGT